MQIIQGARLPVYFWAADLEGEALRQARNLGDLEVAVHHVALMADAHAGFGMPIRGASFAYKDIETVMALSADLVRPVTRLDPPGVVKG